MTDYEPREKTEAWKRLIEAHNAAAEQAAHDEECRDYYSHPCSGWSDGNDEHPSFITSMGLANDAGLELLDNPIALTRRDEIVAQWRLAQ